MSLTTSLRQRLHKREDSEHEQALLRIVIVGLVLTYMAGFHGWPSGWSPNELNIVLILGGFFAVAVALFLAICIEPGRNVTRRLIGMAADVAGCTWYMWVAGEYGFFVIGIYLFITFGNGFRYGTKYLFGCQLLCIAGLVSVVTLVPYWQERHIAGIGLLIALVVLPLYVSTLLKRIQEARARAEEANLAKTTFLDNMSHEMRTPLNGIVGVVDLINTTEMSTQQTELVQLLRHSVSVLRSLVDDVLDISKIEAGRLSIEVSSFDLYASVNSLIKLLRPHALSKGLSLHASVDPALDYRVRGDSHHLRQILLNLLGNAIKFTERGEVTLAVTQIKESQDGITARFEVRDTGIGIPEKRLPHIFERFVQADQSTTRKFGGSGLGTTIAKQLVELMGGTIGVHSQVGVGTTFWFELPLLHDVAADALEPSVLSIDTTRERTILIADQRGAQVAKPLLNAAGEAFEHIDSSESFTSSLEKAIVAGVRIRAVIACCGVDVACTAFATARQRLGDRPLALVFISKEPLSVVDSARIKSLREVFVLDSSPSPKLLANAIHAANATHAREGEQGADLTGVLKLERPSLKILVADDNQTNQTIISQLLASAGHSVLVASDGEEALDLYERENPEVAILDFNMPNRNGLEVIQAIRIMEAPGVHLPTIVLSASVTPEARQRARDAGADEFVGKPFDAAALLQKIDAFAERMGRVPARKATRPTPAKSDSNVHALNPRARADSNGSYIDLVRLAELEDIARDAEFMTVLLRGFKADVNSLVQRIEQCLTSKSIDELPDLLHALKGAAVGVGAQQLSDACDKMSAIPSFRPRDLEDANHAMRKCVAATFAQLDSYAKTQHHVSL